MRNGNGFAPCACRDSENDRAQAAPSFRPMIRAARSLPKLALGAPFVRSIAKKRRPLIV